VGGARASQAQGSKPNSHMLEILREEGRLEKQIIDNQRPGVGVENTKPRKRRKDLKRKDRGLNKRQLENSKNRTASQFQSEEANNAPPNEKMRGEKRVFTLGGQSGPKSTTRRGLKNET